MTLQNKVNMTGVGNLTCDYTAFAAMGKACDVERGESLQFLVVSRQPRNNRRPDSGGGLSAVPGNCEKVTNRGAKAGANGYEQLSHQTSIYREQVSPILYKPESVLCANEFSSRNEPTKR